MFKGTNKFWKGLALLLVLCMLPTVAFAEGEVTGDGGATVTIISATKDETVTPATVTVIAEIGVENTDITILAYRSGDEYDETEDEIPSIPAVESTDVAKGLKDTVVYIDQETADEAEGKQHTFTFIPRAVTGVGKYINIFVGGENVSETDFEQLTLADPSPVVAAPAALYNGCAVELAITKPSESWDDDDTATWYADITTLKVGETALTKDVDYSLKDSKDAIVINYDAVDELDSIAKIEITGKVHADVTVPITEALTWQDKVAGTIKAVAVEPESKIDPVTVTLTLDDSAVDVCKGWIEAIDTSDVKYSTDNGETYVAFTEGVTPKVDGVEVVLPKVVTGKVDYLLQIAVPGYTTVETKEAITVTSPATDAKEKLKVAVAYSDSEFVFEEDGFSDEAYDPEKVATMDPKDKQAQFGVASITLDATGANGTSISWKKGTEDIEPGTYPLERPASSEEATEITYTATITKTIGEEPNQLVWTETKEFTVKVNPVGAGAAIEANNITLKVNKKGNAYGIDGAKVATIKVEKGVVDFSKEVIKVGDTTFLYAPERSTGENDVFVAILRSNNADADTVAKNIVIEPGTTESFYYGKVSYTTSDAKLGTLDAAAAIRINGDPTKDVSNGNAPWTDAQFLAADVWGYAEVSTLQTACIIRANKSTDKSKAEFSVISE